MRETSLTIFVYLQEKAHPIFKNKTLEKLRPFEPTGHCRPTSSVISAYLRKDYQRINTEYEEFVVTVVDLDSTLL